MPRNDDGELDTALAFLTFAREAVLRKTEGLDDEQIRRALVGTGTTLLGLVQHLTVGERYWFGFHVAGIEAADSWDFGMDVPPDRPAAAVLDDYRTAIHESDRMIREAGSPDTKVLRPVDGRWLSVRWVLAHMTTETARHAGHADILREQIDGTTGR
ncbi:mini-circle protein [Paractinoplanes rishiriensis]|uniref:Mini-circle protein n=1 Tax=Paractinoplanes rishiriensis TaxID=1050105 RepID=A0A919JW27_9ACTN|nr:mini-circle protein [Actinoplanes rishiriensis]